MTRARESEEVSEVEEEKATNIVSDWDAPDLAVDLVDQICFDIFPSVNPWALALSKFSEGVCRDHLRKDAHQGLPEVDRAEKNLFC